MTLLFSCFLCTVKIYEGSYIYLSRVFFIGNLFRIPPLEENDFNLQKRIHNKHRRWLNFVSSSNVFFCLHRVLEKEAGTHVTLCYANFLERNHNKPFVDTEIRNVIWRSVLPPRWKLSTETIFPLWLI